MTDTNNANYKGYDDQWCHYSGMPSPSAYELKTNNMKQTIKAKVLDFVESKGEARYTDIIKFVVEHNFGKGAWDDGFQIEPRWEYSEDEKAWVKTGMRRKNTNRGYYSGAFRKPYTARNGKTYYPGYFFTDAGYGKLEKQENGLYKTIR